MLANDVLEEIPDFPENEGGALRKLDFLGYAPCPIRTEMQRRMHAFYTRNEAEFGRIDWYSPGSCGSDGDPYDLIWKTDDPGEMPSVISDGGSSDFFRSEGFEKWIKTGVFGSLGRALPGLRPEVIDAEDPLGAMHMYAAFPAVMLVDLEKLGNRPVPRGWEDLQDTIYSGDITLGGHGGDGNVSDQLLFNTWKNFGEAGLRKFAANVKNFWPPAHMAKMAGSGHSDGTAIYILNLFFARSNRHEDKVRLVWPCEGAWFNPLTVLAKSPDRRRAASNLPIDFLFSREWSEYLDTVGLPSTRRHPGLKPLPGKLSWIGWDLVRNMDMDVLRPRLQGIFNEAKR